MSKMVEIFYVVVYILNGVVHKSVPTNSLETAVSWFNKCKKSDYQARLYSIIDGVEVTLDAINWTDDSYRQFDESDWLKKARKILENGSNLTKPQIDTVLGMDVKELCNIVCCKDINKLCELKGIATKSATKVIRGLKNICKPSFTKIGKSKEFTRVTLNNNQLSNELLVVDTINKMVSPLESKAMELGGKDAIIHVVSIIEENENDEGKMIHAEILRDKWIDLVENGINLNGKKYRVFGHGTNNAKKCQSYAVLESIYDKMREWVNKGTNSGWKNTAAKDISYKCGLHSVYHHEIKIPFEPEDFVIFKSVETPVTANVTKEFLDGHYQDYDNMEVPVARTDGYFMISISPKMKITLHNRMIDKGISSEEADKILDEFTRDTSFQSYRANGAALKGLGDKHIDVQSYLRSRGVKTTPDGRDIDDIVFFVDDTVIKTGIGEGKAYNTFEDWCNAVREELAIGTVVKTHDICKKDVSYQVVQSLCEAEDGTIQKMGAETVEHLNSFHKVDGASKLLGKEWGAIAGFIPELVNEPIFKEQIEREMERKVNRAFSGKILHTSYYNFASPDGFFALDHWFGLEHKPWLKAGQVHIDGISKGELGVWRSPVMHPNSVRVVENIDMPAEYKKFIRHEEYCCIVNGYDDLALAMDMDFDGDHMFETKNEAIIEAIKQTLKLWNRLIIWETPSPDKKAIGEKEIREYFKGLTHLNELGLTVYGLNALLNGLIKVKDPVTGYRLVERKPISHIGVDFKKFAANVLVDASKHGGAEIDEPEESSICQQMLQPLAKQYKDMVDNKKIWYVEYVKQDMMTKYFETEKDAWMYYNGLRYKCLVDENGNPICDESGSQIRIDNFEKDPDMKRNLKTPVNKLDEKADPKNISELWKYKTLNKLFAYYAENIRRDKMIDDRPEGKFDYKKIMFVPDEGRRGFHGLIKKGHMKLTTVNGEKLIPDQGLFDSLARRIDRLRAEYMSDDSIKDKKEGTFKMTVRANALAEIEAFAEAQGKTLKDAYDVITWWMFEHCDKTYLAMDGKLDFLRNKMWQAYRIIFGGMALEAAEENLGQDICENMSENDLELGDDMSDENSDM